MTAFDRAWEVVKAPLYEYPEDIDDAADYLRFTMMPDMRMVSLKFPEDENEGEPYYWQSLDENAKGTIYPEDGDTIVDMFEIAQDLRGKGLARNYLEEMIEDAHEEYGVRPIKVPVMNPDVVGFWNKMKEREVIQ